MEGNQEFSYILIRKKVKNINLRVKPNGSVVVSASPRVPRREIDRFVYSKLPFIQKARARLGIHPGRNPDPGQISDRNSIGQQFVTGEKIPYLGGFLPLQVEKADSRLVPVWIEKVQEGSVTGFSRNTHGEAVFIKGGCLYLYTADCSDTGHMQQLYDAWQKIQAGVLCGQMSRQYYPVFQKHGVAYPQIKIRKMSSRWGSCIPGKQKITFNSLLLEKPLESIEYVVVHEFSHFIHPDHSKEFYNFVAQILPDWRARREGLR